MVVQAVESLLVRVARVRVQNKFGSIFFGHRVNPDGEICDVDEDVTVNLQQNAVGVKLCEGQRWRVKGRIALRNVLTATGFRRVERTVFVSVGGASLVRSSGSQIRDYLRRHPDLIGVGSVTANRLWDRFGEGLYELLDNGNIEALRSVVSPDKAARIVEVWGREGVSRTIQFLANFEIPPVVGRRVVEVHGLSAMDVLKNNPYRLLSYSSAWREVDKLAESLGIASDDSRRLSAACEAVLFSQFSSGHTYVTGEEMRVRLAQLLVAREPAAPLLGELALRLACETGRVLLDSAENVYSLGASVLERQVAVRVQRMIRSSAGTFDVEAFIAEYEAREKLSFKLNERQRDAVGLVAIQHFAVITGGAGCGKTTVLRVICELLEYQGFAVTQLALSGKAVKRMSEASGRTATTIASFLKKRMSEGRVARQPSPTLSTKEAFVIDEASMVDLISFAAIMRVAEDDAKIVLVGDPNQLPPVGPGLVLHVLTAGAAPHIQLEVPNRFGSQIAAFANAIRDGVFPHLDRANPCVQLLEPDGSMDYALCAADLYLQRSR